MLTITLARIHTQMFCKHFKPLNFAALDPKRHTPECCCAIFQKSEQEIQPCSAGLCVRAHPVTQPESAAAASPLLQSRSWLLAGEAFCNVGISLGRGLQARSPRDEQSPAHRAPSYTLGTLCSQTAARTWEVLAQQLKHTGGECHMGVRSR